MSKARILVGVENTDEARSYRRHATDRLTEADIPVTWKPNWGFETPNVEVRFVWDIRNQAPDHLVHAVFGPEKCRKPLRPYLRPDVHQADTADMYEWIAEYEKKAKKKEHDGLLYCREDLQRTEYTTYERLVKAAAKCGASLTVVSNPHLKNMLDEYRKENENMSIPPYVMALANHQGPATIHAGGLSIPVKIMDIDSESHPYKGTETSLRCTVVKPDDIRPAYPAIDTAKLLRSIIGEPIAEKKVEKVDRFAIKRVKLGKAPAIYWENGDKTSIVGPEWYCHSEVHAMAVLFNLRRQGIAQVIFNNPVTMVRWEDGSKVTVRCQEGDVYSAQVGLDMCLAKHLLGTNTNKSNYYDVFKKWLPKPKDESETPTEADETDVTPEAEAVPEAVEEVAPDGE